MSLCFCIRDIRFVFRSITQKWMFLSEKLKCGIIYGFLIYLKGGLIERILKCSRFWPKLWTDSFAIVPTCLWTNFENPIYSCSVFTFALLCSIFFSKFENKSTLIWVTITCCLEMLVSTILAEVTSWSFYFNPIWLLLTYLKGSIVWWALTILWSYNDISNYL